MEQNATRLPVFPTRSLALAAAILLAGLFASGIKAQSMDVFITATPIDCNGGYAYAAVTVTGNATPPYTYLWSNGLTTQNVVITVGTVSVTVTDAGGQSASDTITITQPDTLIVSVVTEQQICGIAPDGSATAFPSGGTPPYSFLWSTGDSTAQITGLAAGLYSVTVTDANNCTAVGQDSVEFWDEGLWLMITPTNIDCYGDSTGMVEVGPMSGTPPYTYIWNTGDTTKKINNLGPGTYSVTVTDVNGCSNSMQAEVTQPDELILILSSPVFACPQDSLCASIEVSGGTPPYNIFWSTGDTTTTICDLPPGIYYVTVTDANGCPAQDSIEINFNPDPLGIEIEVTGCAGCQIGGSAIATATSGVGPFSYEWDNGDTTATATNLTAGPHQVIVTDLSTGCMDTAFVSIPSCPPLEVGINIDVEATCLSGGAATAIPNGGVPPYTYLWDNNQTGQTATGLQAGPHSVTITDSTGCTAVGQFNMPQVPGPDASAEVNVQATCVSSGQATASATGGLAPYTFFWSTGDTSAIVMLPAGTHCVTVTDANGCPDTACVVIVLPESPEVNADLVGSANCNGGGSASANASGGTTPYNYLWSNGETTQTAVNLPPGLQCVTVTDANGCTDSVCVVIPQIDSVVAMITINQQATCLSGATATASGAGGAGLYTYAWSTGEITATVSNLAPGVQYCVTVTDANGCTDSVCVTIQPPNIPSAMISIVAEATCLAGATISVSAMGGTPPFTYNWLPSGSTGTLTNVPPGDYFVTLTDAGGCTATANVTVDPPENPNVIITASSNATCDGPGSATAEAFGGTPPYTFAWDNGETGPTAVNLDPGIHYVTVTDAGGCTDTASVTINLSANGIKIGDFVWYDNDQDGFQDPGEADNGVENIVVMLTQAGPDGIFGTNDDVTVDSDTTDANGMYMFNCVTPGTYVLMFSGIPAGYQWTGKDEVNNDCLDSDVRPDGKTDPFTITQGQGNNLCFDAGIHTFCVNVHFPGVICCNQTICEGDTPAEIYEVQPPAGGSGPLEYIWMTLVPMPPGPPVWIMLPGTNTVNYQPGPLTTTSYFMRCVRREGCENFLETNIVTITVLPAGSPGCGPFLNRFNVEPVSTHAIKVNWVALPEHVPFVYEVEHSMDELSWQTIASVDGIGNETAYNMYEILHQTPLAGRNSYRIKRTDPDGVSSFSEIRSVDMSMSLEESVAVFPNPASDLLYVQNMYVFEKDVQVELISTNGDILHTVNLAAGVIQKLELPVGQLPAGLYLARIRFANGEQRTIKVSKF